MNLERIRTALPGRAILFYDTIDSTMNAAAGRPLGTIVLAAEQTAGQGRHGHSWHSEAGNGLYCSIVLQPAPMLTLALGLATAEAITAVTGMVCDLRWPNDVMIGGKKAAGILVQLVDNLAIGGIGINVSHNTFPAEITAQATSLRLQSGRDFSREDLLTSLIPAVDSFTQMDDASILRLFARASSYASGRRVIVERPEGPIEGVTAGLDSSGFLVIRKDDGTETLVLAGGVRAAGS
jgi:BirA family transcriptional regulator, biotin operon repressor / biotin---[acetyl-CoA-carboxylase] ligase